MMKNIVDYLLTESMSVGYIKDIINGSDVFKSLDFDTEIGTARIDGKLERDKYYITVLNYGKIKLFENLFVVNYYPGNVTKSFEGSTEIMWMTGEIEQVDKHTWFGEGHEPYTIYEIDKESAKKIFELYKKELENKLKNFEKNHF